jgi:hypothetical protein
VLGQPQRSSGSGKLGPFTPAPARAWSLSSWRQPASGSTPSIKRNAAGRALGLAVITTAGVAAASSACAPATQATATAAGLGSGPHGPSKSRSLAWEWKLARGCARARAWARATAPGPGGGPGRTGQLSLAPAGWKLVGASETSLRRGRILGISTKSGEIQAQLSVSEQWHCASHSCDDHADGPECDAGSQLL